MAEAVIDVVGTDELPLIVELYNQIFRPARDIDSFRRRFLGRYNALQMIARVKDQAMRPLDRVADTIRLTPEQQQGLETLRTHVRDALGVLATAYFVGRALRRQPESTANPAVIRTFNLRIRAWWMMFVVLIAGLILGYVATVVLFGLISFWALREFITMTPTRRGDHRTLGISQFRGLSRTHPGVDAERDQLLVRP